MYLGSIFEKKSRRSDNETKRVDVQDTCMYTVPYLELIYSAYRYQAVPRLVCGGRGAVALIWE